MKSIKIPADIILTFPPQTKPTDELIQIAAFSCEQHLNTIGMITYTGPMLQTGTLSYGLRVHMHDPSSKRVMGEVLELRPLEPEPEDEKA
jgi:hypothetical protein